MSKTLPTTEQEDMARELLYVVSDEQAIETIGTLIAERDAYAAAIRNHRDQRGDDRCWEDDITLYKTLPEGYVPPPVDTRVELEYCARYIACRHNPGTVYVSPQRRIEELEAERDELARLRQELRQVIDQVPGDVWIRAIGAAVHAPSSARRLE